MLLFAATIFISAFLLFLVQPLIARVILPWFGGSAAVWTTCLMFFQVTLLAGYTYAHVLTRRARFVFDGRLLDQVEDFFCVRVAVAPQVEDGGWTDDERRWLTGWRWWTADEIVHAPEPVYPECLAALLEWAPDEYCCQA